MNPNNTLFLVLLFGFSGFAQQLISGRVVSDSLAVSGVTVMNLVSEEVTLTDARGEFRILIKQDDMLIFSSVSHEYKRKIIEPEDLQKKRLLIKLIPKVEQLDEVVVLRDIDPESLGIVPKGQKKYTPAERRLKTAGEFTPCAMIGAMAGLSIPIDPIINAITGRTKMLKKEVSVEKREFSIARMGKLYDQKFYTQKLKIAPEYVDGFRFYAAEDAAFATLLERGNSAKLEFRIVELAQEYKRIIAGK